MFTLEPTQLGIELRGVTGGGRLFYSAGYAEGAGNGLQVPSDFWGHLAYKIGGMRLDGESTSDEELDLASPAPWREWSVQIGAFGYAGFPTIGDPEVSSQLDWFYRAGGDVNVQLRDATIILAYSYGRNHRPYLASPTQTDVESHQIMAQLDYVVLPWFIPTARYERRIVEAVDAGTGELGFVATDRVSLATYFLIRANIRAYLLGAIELDGHHISSSEVQVNLRVGF
jgi:hypothetical protein